MGEIAKKLYKYISRQIDVKYKKTARLNREKLTNHSFEDGSPIDNKDNNT